MINNKKIMYLNCIMVIGFINCNVPEENIPYFCDYPVKKIYTGKSASLNLKSHSIAGQFKTRIREILKFGSNFAGHYTIVEWDAGSEVKCCAIVDTKTGNVLDCGPIGCIGFTYLVDSNLFIVDPPEVLEREYESKIPDYAKTRYYLWEKNQFKLLDVNAKTRPLHPSTSSG